MSTANARFEQNPDDNSPPIREFLERSLTRVDMARLDAMIGQLRARDPLDQQAGQDENVEGQQTAAEIRKFLTAKLGDEGIEMLQSLIGELDSGFNAAERADAVGRMADGIRTKSGTKPDDDLDNERYDIMQTTQARDQEDQETAALRRRLRAAHIPVGEFGDAALLRRVARQHGMQVAQVAGDSLPAHLRFHRMYAGVRFPSEKGFFSVRRGPKFGTRRRAGTQWPTILSPSRSTAAGLASLEATFGKKFADRFR